MKKDHLISSDVLPQVKSFFFKFREVQHSTLAILLVAEFILAIVEGTSSAISNLMSIVISQKGREGDLLSCRYFIVILMEIEMFVFGFDH